MTDLNITIQRKNAPYKAFLTTKSLIQNGTLTKSIS